MKWACGGGDERPGDVMIQHDMSLCILCTRCVRACEDIQEVGVLEVGLRGRTYSDRRWRRWRSRPRRLHLVWRVRTCLSTNAIFEVIPGTAIRVRGRGWGIPIASCDPFFLPLLLRSAARSTSSQRRETHAGNITLDQGEYGGFGIDLRQRPLRLRLSSAPRPADFQPLIRKGWEQREEGTWVWTGAQPRHREGPWQTVEETGPEREKPRPPRRSVGKWSSDGPSGHARGGDVRDRVATPDDWYQPFREAAWEEAMSLTAQELRRIRQEKGGDALAALSSAKCTNEDNYLFMRMVRAAFGTNNIDHCTRLCHSTSVAAMSRAMSTSAASGSMREIEEACDVIFIAGANTTESHPVFGALIKRAVARGARLIVADVRQTELARIADIHLQMLPGTDVALYSTMLNWMIQNGKINRAFIEARTSGFAATEAAVAPYSLDVGERITGIPAEKIRQAAEMYAAGPNTSTLWAMGLTQHATGTDIVASLLNLLLGCGMIGRWGAAMIPIRGQNNVQGASDMDPFPSPIPSIARSPIRPFAPSSPRPGTSPRKAFPSATASW